MTTPGPTRKKPTARRLLPEVAFIAGSVLTGLVVRTVRVWVRTARIDEAREEELADWAEDPA